MAPISYLYLMVFAMLLKRALGFDEDKPYVLGWSSE